MYGMPLTNEPFQDYLEKNTVSGLYSFRRSGIISVIDFTTARFSGIADFTEQTFRGYAKFLNATFQS